MKILGNFMSKPYKSATHFLVPMSSSIFVKKGVEANVHSGALAICCFAVLRIFNKKKEHTGNLFIHQGYEVLKLKKEADWATFELVQIQTAPNTKFQGEYNGNTEDLLNKLLHNDFEIAMNELSSKSEVAEKEGWYCSTATLSVAKDGAVKKVESKTSVYKQKDDSSTCTIF